MKLSSFKRGSTSYYIILSAAFLLITASALSLLFLGRDQRNFHHFCHQLLLSELSDNTLNMHYTLASPEDYGIRSYRASLPVYSPDQLEVTRDSLSSSIETLSRIHTGRLSENDAVTHTLLLSQLRQQLQGLGYYYHANPLSPSSGMQSQLPILLAEYTFRSIRDVEDYLELLDQTDTYFQGLTEFLKDQSARGLFMSDSAADKVILQCDEIMDAETIASQEHFLQTTFSQRLNALTEKGILTEAEKKSYLAQNHRLLSTVVLPAYQKLGDELLLLKGTGKNTQGLAHTPDGKAYYQHLLRRSTGSGRSIQEIKQLLLQDFRNNQKALTRLLTSLPEGEALPAEPVFYSNQPLEMLRNLQEQMRADFPPLPIPESGIMPRCTVKYVSPALSPYTSPAFYLTPPLDDISENVIYINPESKFRPAELYTTLAHEGYPGHLYQTVYSQLQFQNTDTDPVRSLLSYHGYVEGWAMYVELKAYDYASEIMKKRAPETETLYQIYRLERQLQLCLYSLLDIAIHYDGASLAETDTILASVGITNPEDQRAIYEYIVEEPCNYLKYYLGYLEILSLRQQAQQLWGSDYSDYRFHSFFLTYGPADYSSLKAWLDN